MHTLASLSNPNAICKLYHIAVLCQLHDLKDLFENIKLNYFVLPVFADIDVGEGLTRDFIKLRNFPGKTKCLHFSHFFSDFYCRSIYVYVDFTMRNGLFQANL